jgi:hypothetical protein
MDEKKNIFNAIGDEISNCVNRTGEIISEGLKKTHKIHTAAILLDRAANDLLIAYESAGYRVQQFRFSEEGVKGILVQIGNDTGAFMNTVKSATGLKLAACVKFLPVDNDLQITVCQGQWLDKVMVNIVSWFVLQPLFVTSLIGIWRQKSLLDQVECYLLDYFANHTERSALFFD